MAYVAMRQHLCIHWVHRVQPRFSLKAIGPSRGFWRIVGFAFCAFATALGFEDGTDACETACPGISDLLTNVEPLMEANSLQSKEEAWKMYCENKTIMDCATSSCAGTLVLGKVIFKSDADELSCVCGSCPDVVKFKEILAHLIFSQTLQQEWDYGCPAVSTVTCMKQSCAAYYDAHSPSIKNKVTLAAKEKGWTKMTRWWFQIFLFTPTWGRFPFWLIFFKWVDTNQMSWVRLGWRFFFWFRKTLFFSLVTGWWDVGEM